MILTPKEKAEELVDKMYGKTPVRDLIAQIEEDKQYAKQCALIAVDEILNHHHQSQGLYRIDRYFWEQVKKEIQSI